MLFPPQWTPAAPSIGIPTLQAHLQAANYKVDAADLNIDFFVDILNPNFLKKSLKFAENIYKDMQNESEELLKTETSDHLTLSVQSKIMKYKTLKEFFDNDNNNSDVIIRDVEKAIRVYKDEKKFYDIKQLLSAQRIIESAIDIAFMPFSPTRCYFTHYHNPLLKYTYENIKFHCFSEENNIFLHYYPEKIKEIVKPDHKLITISINSNSQIIPGLTLANILKTKYKKHVNIGGDYFKRIYKTLFKYPEFFDDFADSILIGDAEDSIVKLADFIEGKITVNQVPGLIYKSDKNIVELNLTAEPVEMDEVKNISLDNYDLSKYFAPEIVLPLKSSRNCKWNKCVFCDLYYGTTYSEKKPENLVKDIEELKEKYNISNFEFMDSAIEPEYYSKFADLLFKKELNISYYSFARLEEGFTEELLGKLYKSGLKMLVWGYESASERIIKLMNKKMDIKNRHEILKNSHKSGIYNLIFNMLGFPTETAEEAKLTMDTLAKNIDILSPLPPSICVVQKNAKLLDFMKKENIDTESFSDEEEFDIGLNYACGEENLESILKIRQEGLKKYKTTYKDGFPLCKLIQIRAHLLLYLNKYKASGLKKIH